MVDHSMTAVQGEREDTNTVMASSYRRASESRRRRTRLPSLSSRVGKDP